MSDEAVNIPVVWEEADEGPVLFTNQFLIQHQPDEFVLSFGQILPPPLLGTEEQKREQLSRLNYLPIRVLGRFALNRNRLVELIAVLQANLDHHDEMMKRIGDR